MLFNTLWGKPGLLWQVSRIQQTAHGGHTIDWNTCAAGVLANGVLVRSQVDAVEFVFGD
ncbi:MAG: hypothetical protein QOJ99_3423, partial [Bryobacterales bacterium]|nr:hypothetical protein [Bryobacterales bacterium]